MKLSKKILIISISIICCTVIISAFAISNFFKYREVQIELDPNYNELFSYEEQLKHDYVLDEYSSNLSVAYMNKDGTKTIYIFSSPIKFVNKSGKLSLIDTRIVNVSETSMRERGYIYTISNSDIKPYYPKYLSDKCGIVLKNEIEYEFGIFSENAIRPIYKSQLNILNEEKYMLVYENAFGRNCDFKVYPSSKGSSCEIEFEEKPESDTLSTWVKITEPDIYLKKEPGGYIVIAKDKLDVNGVKTYDILGVIQKPLLKNKNGDFSYNNSLEILPKDNGLYEIKLMFDKNMLNKGSVAFLSFEMRRESQPDNALYSKLPNLENAYLCNASVIGNNMEYGIGRLMIRFKFTKNFNLDSSQIQSATFYTYSLNNNKNQFELLSILEDWCSITGNWNKNYKTGDRTSVFSQQSNELKFDITNEVKKWCDDKTGQMEHNGVMLKSINENEDYYNIILSNDNTLYKIRTEVTLK